MIIDPQVVPGYAATIAADTAEPAAIDPCGIILAYWSGAQYDRYDIGSQAYGRLSGWTQGPDGRPSMLGRRLWLWRAAFPDDKYDREILQVDPENILFALIGPWGFSQTGITAKLAKYWAETGPGRPL